MHKSNIPQTAIVQNLITSDIENSQEQLSVDAQQQTKFHFNDVNDKTLQLWFQLPTEEQQPPASTSFSTAINNSQSPPLSAIPQSFIPNNVTLQQQLQQQQQVQQQQQHFHHHHHHQQSLVQAQGQPHCTQHSLVQVSTQTQQQLPLGVGGLISPINTQTHTAQVPNINSDHQTPINIKAGTTTTAKKTIDKISKKDKSRYANIRQAPPGQSAYHVDSAGIVGSASSMAAAAAAAGTAQFPAVSGNAVVPDRTIDVDSETDSNHDTALTLACAGGHEELVELLLTRGACIEHKDKKGFTPLILAATAGHDKVVDILIKNSAEVEAQSERTKDTPLSLACSGGRYEVVELLLGVGANKEHRNVSDYTPLSLAASGGYVNIIKLLLHNGAEINSRTGSKLGISPLMLAAMNGHTAAVKLLLDMGSDINAQIETNRNTALTLACFQGRHEVVSLLLDRKANVEHRAKTGLTPLMEAASGGYIEVGRVLLDKGADVNAAPVPSSRDTALTIAADKGHLKFVELLLSRNAAVEVKNKKGNSPLWLAANGGHIGVVEVLCKSGADIDSQDNRKVSCLMAAFRKGHTKVVKWMVNHVAQFPSDQEMTRYISTISDKELSEKCHDCVKVIRAAKETQATKANRNASILLRELDMEKTREESRKLAAAKRRERKKRRKAEKREQQRKLVEGDKPSRKMKIDIKDDDDDDDDDEEDDDDDDSDNDEPLPDPIRINTYNHNNNHHHHHNHLQQHNTNNNNINNTNITTTHTNNNISNEREEGDSGIDANSQGSCSSTDAKPNLISTNANKRNNKKKKSLEDHKQKRSQNSPISMVNQEKINIRNKDINSDMINNKTNKNKDTTRDTTTVTIGAKKELESLTFSNIKKDLPNKPENIKLKEKENVAPKYEDAKTISSVKYDKKNDIILNAPALTSLISSTIASVSASVNNQNSSQNCSGSTSTINSKSHTSNYEQQQQPPQQSQQQYGNSRNKSLVFVQARHTERSNNDFDFHDYISKQKTKSFHSMNDDSKTAITTNTSPTKQYHYVSNNSTGTGGTANSGLTKREDGWKEVVRNRSVQQQQPSIVTECKKVQIPVHAISRVIGRAGSNINAIRAATGAHIEVEKQGKVQGDRSITIKGSLEATKQAHNLIATLVKDPDVDILQMLPKNNNNTIITSSSIKPLMSTPVPAPSSFNIPSQSSVTNPWDKNILNTNAAIAASAVNIGSISNSSISFTPAASTSLSGNKMKFAFTPNSNASSSATTSTNASPTTVLTSKSITQTGNLKPLVAKNLFTTQSTSSRVVTTSSVGRPLSSSSEAITSSSTTSSINSTSKRLIASTTGPPANASKPISNAIQALKNTIKNAPTATVTNSTSGGPPPGTFASKLISDKKITPPSSTASSSASTISANNMMSSTGARTSGGMMQSPKHHNQGLPAPFGNSNSNNNNINSNNQSMNNTNVTSSTTVSSTSKHNLLQNNNSSTVQQDSNANTNTSGTVNNSGVRSITPIGPPNSQANRNVSSSPLLMASQINAEKTNLLLQQQQQQSIALAAQLHSKLNSNLHGNAQAHEYSLFNDSYSSSQWDGKKLYAGSGSTFIENEPLKVDASKAPGYRGNAVSSPVSSSKSSSNSTTPPSSNASSTHQQQQMQSQSMSTTVNNNSNNQSQSTSASVIGNQTNLSQSHQRPFPSPTDLKSQIQQGSAPSGLAVQRPIINTSSQVRPLSSQMDSFNLGSVGQNLRNDRQNMFDQNNPLTGGNGGVGGNNNNNQPQMMNYGHLDSQQSSFSHLGLVSRLNPKASAFSSIQHHQNQGKMNQNQFNNMYHHQQNVSGGGGGGGLNNYQQKPLQNQLHGGSMQPQSQQGPQQQPPPMQQYNPAPGRPQSLQHQQQQQQQQHNARGWFSDMNQMSSRDFVNIENGLAMGLLNGSSPAISPNNPQQQSGNNILQSGIQQQSAMPDDSRKIRPIGTERSWKYNFGGGLPLDSENLGQGVPPWLMDKTPPMQHWMQPPPLNQRVNHFDDMHVQQEQFQVSNLLIF